MDFVGIPKIIFRELRTCIEGNSFRYAFNFILVLFAVSIFSCKNCIDVDVPYEEQVPYEATETYSVDAKYDGKSTTARDYDCLEKNFWGTCLQKRWFLNVETTIENREAVPVDFEVIVYFDSDYEGETNQHEKIRIRAFGSEIVTMKYYLQSEMSEYRKPKYNIVAGQIEKERKVTKHHTTTKYRKCNTCVEECGSKYKKESGIPWWGYVIILVIVLSIIGKVIEWFKD